MPNAARVGDDHHCTHGNGPIIEPASPNVDTNAVAQARASDYATCPNGQVWIMQGSSTVYVNNLPAARQTDRTTHTGTVVVGSDNVEIGGAAVIVTRVGNQVRIGGCARLAQQQPRQPGGRQLRAYPRGRRQ